jgi:hypothetical protein
VGRPASGYTVGVAAAEPLPGKHEAPPEGEAKCLKRLAGRAGIEPATNGLGESGPNRDHCSNQALATHAKFQEQPCTALSEAREGMQSYEIATLAIVDVNPIA